MGSNVVYNPESGTWVASGSSDDPGGLGEPSGKSAYEYQYEKKKKQREEIGRERVDRKKQETLKEYQQRLNKKRLEEKRKYQEKQLQQKKQREEQQKKQREEQQKNILKQVLEKRKKQSISPRYKETKPYRTKYQELYYSQDYKDKLKQQEKRKFPILTVKDKELDKKQSQLQTTGQKPIHQTTKGMGEEDYLLGTRRGIYKEVPEDRRATFITSNPYISGAKKGAKQVAIGGAIAVTGTAISYAVPPLTPAVTTIGYGLGATYGGSVAYQASKGKYYRNPEAQTQLATEIVGFAGLGKGIEKTGQVKGKIQKARFERKIKTREQEITTQEPTKYGKYKIEKEITTDTGAKKRVTEYQKQFFEGKRKVKTSEEYAQETGYDFVYVNPADTKPATVYTDQPVSQGTTKSFYEKLGRGEELVFQAKTKSGTTKQVFRTKSGDFKAYEVKQGEVKPKDLTPTEKQQIQENIGKPKVDRLTKSTKDIFDYQTIKVKKGGKGKKYESVFKPSAMFRSKKAQISRGRSIPREGYKSNLYKERKPIFEDKIKTPEKTLSKSEIRVSGNYPKISPLGVSIGFKDNQETGYNIVPTENQKPMDNISPKQEPIQDVKPKQEPIQDVKPKQEPIQDVKPKQEPIQDVKPKQKPIQDVSPKTPTTPTTPTPKTTYTFKTPPKPKPKPKPTPKKLKIGSKSNKKPAYEVYVRNGEKWQKKGQNLPRNRALQRGSTYTDNNPQTKFKIVQTGKTQRSDVSKPTLKKFERKNNYFVEKKQYRKDKIGERMGKKKKWL